MGDVGRGAAHVEADDPVEAGLAGGARHADDAARRAGQDRVLAAEDGGVGEAAVRLHEEEAARLGGALAQAGHDLVDVAAQHRREIGVDDRVSPRPISLINGSTSWLAETWVKPMPRAIPASAASCAVQRQPCISTIATARSALVVGRLQRRARRRLVERAQHRAVGADALVDLDDPVVERLGQDDLAREDMRAAPGSRSAARRRSRW